MKRTDERNGFFITRRQMETLDSQKSDNQSKTNYVESILHDILKGNYDYLLKSKPDYDKRVVADKHLTKDVRDYLKPLGYSVPEATRLILDNKHQTKSDFLIYGNDIDVIDYMNEQDNERLIDELYHSYLILNARDLEFHEYDIDIVCNKEVMEIHTILKDFYETINKQRNKKLLYELDDLLKYRQMIKNALAFQKNLHMKFHKGYTFD